jgi:WD40 repeat protein
VASSVPTQATEGPASPSAPSAAPTSAAPSGVLVETKDLNLEIVSADGHITPFARAGVQLASGPNNRAQLLGEKLYAISDPSATSPSRAYTFDASGAQPLAVVAQPPQGIAVWPGSGSQPARIAWGEVDFQQSPVPTRLMIAPIGAARGTTAYETTSSEGLYAVPLRWAPDGQHLYFSMEPSGLGGYILFGGRSSLYALDVGSGATTEIIPVDLRHSVICLDDLSPDNTLIARHCDGAISVTNLQSGQRTKVNLPKELTPDMVSQSGDVRFSPDGTRLAFAMAKGDSTNEQGWVGVTDDLTGSSRLVATAPKGSYYSVLGWFDGNTLLIEAHNLNQNLNSLQVLTLDGSQPREFATDSIFITFVVTP